MSRTTKNYHFNDSRKSFSRGAHTHYNQAPCNGGDLGINKVRTWPHHPIRMIYNNPNRKSYVIENRTNSTVLLSISETPRNETTKYFSLNAFDEQTFFVNTSKQMHQYVRIHDSKTHKILDIKFLNPVYSLMTILKDFDCNLKLQLQVTPLW